MTDWWRLDAWALSQQLAAGRVTPVALLEHYLGRIARLNPTLNAVVCLNPQAAAAARHSAERLAAGRPASRIDGLPLLIKDNLMVRGMPASWGSRLYAERVAGHDELPVETLRRAGAVIVGKTNVPEFTLEGYTGNALFGVTRNPWDDSLTPGGSSGGSVAAVAAGLAPAALGTDGGGSIRRPAAYTSLVGLKPSIGRIPRGGGLPPLLLDMEVVGTLTRSVRDQALLFDLLARRDRRDHRSRHFADPSAAARLRRPPTPLRVLAVERFADAPLDPAIAASFRQMTELLTALGHRVETGELPLDIDELYEHWASLGQLGLARLLEREPRFRRLASPQYLAWAETRHPATQLLRLTELIDGLRNQAARAFAAVDIILTPSCAAMPWPAATPFPPYIDGQAVGPRGSAVYTGWVNACGHPAISVPGQPSETGLPIGIQLVADFGRDELLLRLAQQIEDRQSWLDRWPGCCHSEEPS